MKTSSSLNRRAFLKGAGAAAAGVVGFPYLIRSASLGLAGTTSPSNRIIVGCIGVGWQGGSNMGGFLAEPDVRVAAVCDIDSTHLEEARNRVDGSYQDGGCKTYTDFRDLLADPVYFHV